MILKVLRHSHTCSGWLPSFDGRLTASSGTHYATIPFLNWHKMRVRTENRIVRWSLYNKPSWFVASWVYIMSNLLQIVVGLQCVPTSYHQALNYKRKVTFISDNIANILLNFAYFYFPFQTRLSFLNVEMSNC